MRQLLQKICCFWQAGSLQKYPPPPGVADINLNSPGGALEGRGVRGRRHGRDSGGDDARECRGRAHRSFAGAALAAE